MAVPNGGLTTQMRMLGSSQSRPQPCPLWPELPPAGAQPHPVGRQDQPHCSAQSPGLPSSGVEQPVLEPPYPPFFCTLTSGDNTESGSTKHRLRGLGRAPGRSPRKGSLLVAGIRTLLSSQGPQRLCTPSSSHRAAEAVLGPTRRSGEAWDHGNFGGERVGETPCIHSFLRQISIPGLT